MDNARRTTHDAAQPVFVALANPRTARSLMRVGLALAEARGARTIAVSVAPMGTGQLAETTPALRRLRAMVHRMVEMAAARGQQVTGLVRVARSVPEGLAEVVGAETARAPEGEQDDEGRRGDARPPLLVVGWPAVDATMGEGLGLIGMLAAAPPCDLVFVRGRVAPHWRGVMLAQRGGPHTQLAQQVALELAGMGGHHPDHDGHDGHDGHDRHDRHDRHNQEAVAAPATLTALHVVPDYLGSKEAAVEEAAFGAYWTRDEPVQTRPRLVKAPAAPRAIVHESWRQDLLVLDAAPTGRAYPFPLGRTAHEVIATARPAVLVAKSATVWTSSLYDGARDIPRQINNPPPPGAGSAPPAQGAAPAREAGSAAPPTGVSAVDRWFAEHTFAAREFANAAELAALKERLGVSVGLALVTAGDAEGAEETIGPLIRSVRDDLVLGRDTHLIDEILVVDSGAADDTLALARSLGATALDPREVVRAAGSFRGRGEALWKTLSVATSDVLVCLNPAVAAGAARAVCGLLGPLLHDERLHLVAGFSRRALRVSVPTAELPAELVVRPLLNVLFPELAGLITPLPGDYAARTATLRSLPIVGGEAVELGLLLDVLRYHGLGALAQVDLETRPAREYEPRQHGRLAFALVQALLRRLDEMHTEVRLLGPMHHILRLPYLQENGYGLESADVPEIERPPLEQWLSTARQPG